MSDQVLESIVAVLRVGGYPETAAEAAGISTRTFYTWLARGDPAGKDPRNAPYRVFRERVEGARAQGEQRNVDLIVLAAQSNWKAAAWLLERQFPLRWAAAPRGRERVPEPVADPEPVKSDVVDDQVGADGRPL